MIWNENQKKKKKKKKSLATYLRINKWFIQRICIPYTKKICIKYTLCKICKIKNIFLEFSPTIKMDNDRNIDIFVQVSFFYLYFM